MGFRLLFVVLSLYSINSTVSSGEGGPVALQTARVGQIAPVIKFNQLLQAPNGARTDWASLRGKVVVLEFWSTKCAPCLRWTPHLNKLGASFENKPVVFISITNEDERTVRRCLKKFPIHGWIGLDRDNSISDAYGIQGLPTTVIVGKDGMLLGWSHPMTLVAHPEMIDAVLAGKIPELIRLSSRTKSPDIDLYRDIDVITNGEKSKSKKKLPLCSILIRESEGGKKRQSNGLADYRNSFDEDVTMLQALASAYNTTAPYIVSETPLPEYPKYDILLRWNKGRMDVGTRLLQEALQATFGIEIRREKRAMNVYVLGYPIGQKPIWEPGKPALSYDSETGMAAPTDEILKRMIAGEKFFHAMGSTKRLTQHLAHAFDKPVVDDTHIDGRYQFCFLYDRNHDDAQVIIKALRDKYGLTLTLAKREIEVLAVYQDDGN
ncbi:TIGR03435 family protein [bacterium AH-315-J04]|nr:TIGR03435 family protein [bacterium AH-315-J04]